jgi:hypothetical protein
LIITISDTCKNQPKRLDFDNTINLSSLIVSLVRDSSSHCYGVDKSWFKVLSGLSEGVFQG